MTPSTDILTVSHPTPCGTLLLGVVDGRLCMCDWHDGRPRVISRLTRYLHASLRPGHTPTSDMARRALDSYFAGHPLRSDIPLLMCGTPLQLAVWGAISRIAPGHTATYADIARMAGNAAAVRAAATAVGDNALSVFVPCHRVVSTANPLLYAGGAEAKRTLLELEKSFF